MSDRSSASAFRRSGSFVRRIAGPNGDLAVLSVLLAVAAVSIVHRRVVAARHERTWIAPVTVRCEKSDWAVFSVSPAAVALTVRGTQDELAAFDRSRLSVELSSRNPRGQTNETLRIRRESVVGVGDLFLVRTEPSSVSVVYDPMVQWPSVGRIAPPQMEGAPLQGMADIVLPTNAVVYLKGSESKIRTFREKKILLPTSPVNVEGKTESFETDVAILPPPDSGIVSVEPATVRVRVEITTFAAPEVAEDNAPLERVGGVASPSRPAAGAGDEADGEGTNAPPAAASGPDGEAEAPEDGEDESAPPPDGGEGLPPPDDGDSAAPAPAAP